VLADDFDDESEVSVLLDIVDKSRHLSEGIVDSTHFYRQTSL